MALIVNGFVKDVIQQLPMEFAVEAQKLIGVSLEGSVGVRWERWSMATSRRLREAAGEDQAAERHRPVKGSPIRECCTSSTG